MFLDYILIGLILCSGAYIFTGNGAVLASFFMWAFGWPIIICIAVYQFIQSRKASKRQ